MTINWEKVITILLGIYGAGLTTYTIWDKRRDRNPSIKVSLAQGIPLFGNRAGDPMLTIRASNHGEKEIKLTGVGLYLPKTKQNAPIFQPRSDRPFPCVLPAGESCSVFLDLKDTAQDMLEQGFTERVKLRAYIGDAADRRYLSNTFVLRTREWAAWTRRAANPHESGGV